MNTYQQAINTLTTDKERLSLRQAIANPSLGWLLDSEACSICFIYLLDRTASAPPNLEIERERAGCLLVILAAMQVGTDNDKLEALRLIATKRVDTRGAPLKARYELAGKARARPVNDHRHYLRHGHLKRMRDRLADELYDLMWHQEILERAIEIDGDEAVMKYL